MFENVPIANCAKLITFCVECPSCSKDLPFYLLDGVPKSLLGTTYSELRFDDDAARAHLLYCCNWCRESFRIDPALLRDLIASMDQGAAEEFEEVYESYEPERKNPLRVGEPCSHPGCLNHVSHPCEGCGRVGGVMRDRTTEESALQVRIKKTADKVDIDFLWQGERKYTYGMLETEFYADSFEHHAEHMLDQAGLVFEGTATRCQLREVLMTEIGKLTDRLRG